MNSETGGTGVVQERANVDSEELGGAAAGVGAALARVVRES